ncbi:MAG: hypothetical protein AAGB51_00580 [Planctomycetota bacterium]
MTTALAASVCLAAPAAEAQFGGARGRLYQNAKVITPSGNVREVNMMVAGPSVMQIGPDVAGSPFGPKTDLEGRFVTPGLIDAASSILLQGGFGTSGTAATSRASDAIDVFDDLAIRDAWRNGVTSVFVPAVGQPGIAGKGALVRLTPTATIEDDEAALCIRLDGASASERLAVFAEVREAFRQAKLLRESRDIYEGELEDYEDELKKALEEWEKSQEEDPEGDDGGEDEAGDEDNGDDEPAQRTRSRRGPGAEDNENGDDGEGDDELPEGPEKPERPGPDPAADVLLEAIEGRLPVRILAHSSADITSAIELAEAAGVELTIVGGAESHLLAEELADAEGSVILTPAPDRFSHIDAAARISTLLDHDIDLCVGSGFDSASGGRFVLLQAQWLGADERDSLALVTRDAAGVLGAPTWGRLGQGLNADFVVWSSDPRLGGAQPYQVYVAGELVWESPNAGEGDS